MPLIISGVLLVVALNSKAFDAFLLCLCALCVLGEWVLNGMKETK